MGNNNGGTSTGVREHIIERQYYQLGQACEKINAELGLSSKDLIMPHTLQYWRKQGFINYEVRQGSTTRIPAKNFHEIKAFTFFKVLLGIEYKRIQSTMTYLTEIACGDQDKINFLVKQINIYDSSRK